MTTRTRLVARSFGRRDARLFVVATEGARTEPAYFDVLKLNEVVDRTRVVVEVIPTPLDTNDSAPEHVLARLRVAEEHLNLQEMDERWLVLDVDRWGAGKLSTIAQQAVAAGYRLAISNPCFEVWLLLHHAGASPAKARDLEIALRAALGGYAKSALDARKFTRETVEAAIARAEVSDPSPEGRWPQPPAGTHVYRLLQSLGVRGRPPVGP